MACFFLLFSPLSLLLPLSSLPWAVRAGLLSPTEQPSALSSLGSIRPKSDSGVCLVHLYFRKVCLCCPSSPLCFCLLNNWPRCRPLSFHPGRWDFHRTTGASLQLVGWRVTKQKLLSETWLPVKTSNASWVGVDTEGIRQWPGPVSFSLSISTGQRTSRGGLELVWVL